MVLSSGPKIDLSRPSPQPRCVSVGLVRSHMLFVEVKIRRFSGAVSGALFAISVLPAGAFIPASAAAQTGEPVKIGYSMALTGGLGPNGRSALLAQKIWEEDTNAKGGLLGRPVKLIHYDDQTNPATVPDFLHQGLLRRRAAAESEAEYSRDRGSRRGVRPECLGRSARECQSGRPHRRL